MKKEKKKNDLSPERKKQKDMVSKEDDHLVGRADAGCKHPTFFSP